MRTASSAPVFSAASSQSVSLTVRAVESSSVSSRFCSVTLSFLRRTEPSSPTCVTTPSTSTSALELRRLTSASSGTNSKCVLDTTICVSVHSSTLVVSFSVNSYANELVAYCLLAGRSWPLDT